MSKKYTEEDLYKKALKSLEGDKTSALNAVADNYAAKAEKLNAQADIEKNAAREKYADELDRSSVEKMVNTKKLEERLANLGLSNSGYGDASRSAVTEQEKRTDEDIERKIYDDKSAIDEKLAEDLEKNYAAMDAESDKVYEEYEKKARNQASQEAEQIEKQEAEQKAREEEESKAQALKDKDFMEKRNNEYKTLKVHFDLNQKRYGRKMTSYQKYDLLDKLISLEKKYKGTIGALTDYEIASICNSINVGLDYYRNYAASGAKEYAGRYATKTLVKNPAINPNNVGNYSKIGYKKINAKGDK